MSTKNQIILLTIIALMASLGFAATTLLRFPVLPQRQQTTVAKKELPTVTTQSTSTDQVAMAYQAIENGTSSYIGFDLDSETKMVLVSKSFPADGVRKTYFLWAVDTASFLKTPSPDLIKSFSGSSDSDVSFTQDQGDAILTIQPSADSGNASWFHPYEYHRYGYHGYEKFSFLQTDTVQGASVKTEHGDFTVQPIFSPSCTTFPPSGTQTTSLVGLRVADSVIPLTHSTVTCPISGDMIPETVNPMLIFKGYDPFYSTLSLELPDGRSVMIDVETHKIVASKERYDAPCAYQNFDATSTLTYSTPNGTAVLAENVWDDPLLKDHAGTDLCWDKTKKMVDGNPVFLLLLNYAEGYNTIGSYEFDLKTHTFKKIK